MNSTHNFLKTGMIFLYLISIFQSGLAHSDLNYYLQERGFFLSPMHSSKNEGYMNELQKEQFLSELSSYNNINSVLEIGLNAGHSAEVFFNGLPNLINFYSFDLNIHDYTKIAVDYFNHTYPQAFHFIPGDSRATIKKLRLDNQIDLIYIDGNHSFWGCYNDILNCRRLAHKNTILWIDDYDYEVKKAVDLLEKRSVIYINKIFESHSDLTGDRKWVKCRYVSTSR